MSEPARIFLCFHSAKHSEIELALNYWDTNPEGDWRITSQELADLTGSRKHKILELVRQAATAYDMTIRCMDCQVPRVINSRTDTQFRSWPVPYTCSGCSQARITAQRLKEEEEQRQERERLTRIIECISNEEAVFDYSDISYFDALLAYG